jgi:nucleotide-binding universal stress UspA family protein
VFAHATALARRFNAHVEVIHCRPQPKDLLPFGVPIPAMLREQLLQSVSTLSDVEETALRTELQELCEQFNLKMTDDPKGQVATATFVEKAGRQVDVIRRNGRLADLIAVPQPDVDRNLGANTLNSALFHTSRPVLMCPDAGDNPPQILAQSLTIAWNGSLEATRAVAMTLDLIKKAQTVTILSATDKSNMVGPDELQDYLAVRGVDAQIRDIKGSGAVAKRLLAISADVGADMMIMGAYGDSHERETVLGGNTQYIVDKAKMPVVLVH